MQERWDSLDSCQGEAGQPPHQCRQSIGARGVSPANANVARGLHRHRPRLVAQSTPDLLDDGDHRCRSRHHQCAGLISDHLLQGDRSRLHYRFCFQRTDGQGTGNGYRPWHASGADSDLYLDRERHATGWLQRAGSHAPWQGHSGERDAYPSTPGTAYSFIAHKITPDIVDFYLDVKAGTASQQCGPFAVTG